jgi:hypothetical protein
MHESSNDVLLDCPWVPDKPRLKLSKQ